MQLDTQDHSRRRQKDFLPLAVVGFLAFLACCLVGGWILLRIVRSVGDGLGSAFKPTVSYTTLISGAVGRLQQESKLIVLRAEVAAEVTKESQKMQRLFGYDLDLGTTMVRIRARENQVQFFVPLTSLSDKSFEYQSREKRLVFRAPLPRLDTNLVEVQSDPAKIEVDTRVGWARLDSYSGQFLRDEAKRELRPAVLAVANNELLTDKAKLAARESLQALLRPVSGALMEGVELWIEFEPETNAR
jgi:hypothetical protein